MKSKAILISIALVCGACNVSGQELRDFVYEIVEVRGETLLVNRLSGQTWALGGDDELRWTPVLREAASDEIRDQDKPTNAVPTQLTVESFSAGSAVPESPTLIRLKMKNRTSKTVSRWKLTGRIPDGCRVQSATENWFSSSEDGQLCWEGRDLKAGESKLIEVQVEFSSKTIGRRPVFEWRVEADGGSGFRHSHSLSIKNTTGAGTGPADESVVGTIEVGSTLDDALRVFKNAKIEKAENYYSTGYLAREGRSEPLPPPDRYFRIDKGVRLTISSENGKQVVRRMVLRFEPAAQRTGGNFRDVAAKSITFFQDGSYSPRFIPRSKPDPEAEFSLWTEAGADEETY